VFVKKPKVLNSCNLFTCTGAARTNNWWEL